MIFYVPEYKGSNDSFVPMIRAASSGSIAREISYKHSSDWLIYRAA